MTFLPIATITKPHGVRGELRMVCSDEHLEYLATLPLVRINGRDMQLSSLRGDPGGALIIALDGVEDRTGAEALRGATIEADRADLPPLAQDEVYLADLVGCTVRCNGADVGTVLKATAYPANAVLTIRLDADPDNELLAPFTRDAVPALDIAARTIDVDLEFLGVSP